MRKILLYVQVVFYALAGVNHFLHPAPYLSIMPPWLPAHLLLVYVSGICETALGLLLLFPATRHLAAWGIIALLIAIYPANIQMLVNYIQTDNPYTWLAVVRLPLQLLLIWWAWIYTRPEERKKTNRPFK